MTVIARTSDTERASRAAVTEFFDRFQAHDVEGMGLLCSINASFHYVPTGVRRNGRLQRAEGTVHGMGKAIWHGLISSFPDLSLTVATMTANAEGDVIAQVDVTGTQSKPWGLIRARGQRFTEPHLFILHVDDDQLIDAIAAYWNDASIQQQLGRNEID